MEPNSKKKNILFQYLFVLAGALVLYGFTCAPTVLWQDSGLFVYRIWQNDMQGNLGIALAHPLYILIGMSVKLIPVGELAWRINMISAVFGAVAVANLFLLLRLWLERLWPALIGAITLAVSWTFWQNAVLAEVYTLYAAQLFTELIILLLYFKSKKTGYLYLLGLLNGLSIANHLWGVFPLLCYLIFILFKVLRKDISVKTLTVFIVLWIVGALPYEYLVIRNLFITGDFASTVRSALFGIMWQEHVLNTSVTVKIVAENIIFLVLNFPTPNIILLAIGIFVLWKKAPAKSFANILAAMCLLFFVFAFRYTVADRHAFFLPFYCICAIFFGIGADVVFRKFQSKTVVIVMLAFSLLPVPAYAVASEAARKCYKSLAQRRQRPYRDEYKYWLRPWKTGYYGAERFATEALQGVEENAIIYAYTTDVHAMIYTQQIKGVRPDVRIVSVYNSSPWSPDFNEETIAGLLAESAVYVTADRPGYCPKFILDNYELEKAGHLWRVVNKYEESETNGVN
ncbi:MAG: DUF2723 domain-containing protein [Sedimentisphaerales bacterium]|nr:DUF2723 domain-containing protein [Sedimentisphaerales bacterium]